MALAKKWDKSNWSLIFERPNRRERERRRGKERRRGRGREEEEKKGRRRSSRRIQRYGTTWNSKVLYEFPCLDGY